ncbi:hypothetical protein B0H14DRAFT_2800726, partial [Mycena olivaceomarginata]
MRVGHCLSWWHAIFSETLHRPRHHMCVSHCLSWWHAIFSETPHWPRHHMCVSHCLLRWQAIFSETLHRPKHHMRVGHCLLRWHAIFSKTPHRPGHHMRVSQRSLRWQAIFSKTLNRPRGHMCVSHPVAVVSLHSLVVLPHCEDYLVCQIHHLQGFKSVNILILTLTLLSGLWIICPLMNSHLSIIHTFHLFLRLCCLYACSSGRQHCTLCFQCRAQGCRPVLCIGNRGGLMSV